jgi:hypothetical protein
VVGATASPAQTFAIQGNKCELDDLVRKYAQEFPSTKGSDTQTFSTKAEEFNQQQEEDESLSYLRICQLNNLDPKDPSNDDTIQEYIDMGFYNRRPLPSKKKVFSHERVLVLTFPPHVCHTNQTASR